MAGNHLPLAILMLIAGIGIPVMAALNANLGSRLESPILAVAILCLVAATTAIILVFGFSTPVSKPVWSANPINYLSGVLFILYIGSITYSAPHIGLGNAIFLVILGQLMSAALIDHFGWFGTLITQLSWKRGLGLLLMAMGVYLARAAIPHPVSNLS